MAITTQGRKMLWGRAASRCAFSECRLELAQISEAAGHAVIIGEEAHIVAQSPDGPRGDSPLTPQQRDEYSNLVLLCPSHHTLVDKAPVDYSVLSLQAMKLSHERWVSQTLGSSSNLEDEKWAAIIDELDARLEVSEWEANMSGIFGGYQASMNVSTEEHLRSCVLWIAKRPWPQGHEDLKETIVQIGTIINEFIYIFGGHSSLNAKTGRVEFEKFYRQAAREPIIYRETLKEYEEIRAYMNELIYELTKYVNLFSDEVRTHIDPSYRYEEGYASLKIEGDFLRFDTHIPKISVEELAVGKQPLVLKALQKRKGKIDEP